MSVIKSNTFKALREIGCNHRNLEHILDWFDDNEEKRIRIDLIHNNASGTYRFTLWTPKCDGTWRWERISQPISFLTREERTNKALLEAVRLIKPVTDVMKGEADEKLKNNIYTKVAKIANAKLIKKAFEAGRLYESNELELQIDKNETPFEVWVKNIINKTE